MELSHQMLLIADFLRKLFFEHYLVMKPHILISLLDNRASIQRRPREKAYKKMLSL